MPQYRLNEGDDADAAAERLRVAQKRLADARDGGAGPQAMKVYEHAVAAARAVCDSYRSDQGDNGSRIKPKQKGGGAGRYSD